MKLMHLTGVTETKGIFSSGIYYKSSFKENKNYVSKFYYTKGTIYVFEIKI